jgi:deoxyribodipyrimidine photo-lyase
MPEYARARPWFRIFNPVTQSERFDAQATFIRRYLPEFARVPDRYMHAPWTLPAAEQQRTGCVIGRDYPMPLVDHAAQRGLALALFKQASRQVSREAA